jgi:hypothetical protein
MTTMRTKLAQALPFAHLLGLGVRAEDDNGGARRGSRAEDDERDEDDKKGKRAEDDDKDEKKDARRAEEDDDKDERAEDDKDDQKDDDKDGKRANSKADDEDLDDDDDSDDEMRGKSANAKARRRERARCAAIFNCEAAGVRPDVAASLAFTTTMSRKEAISVLRSAAAGGAPTRGASLADRMGKENPPNVTGDGGNSSPSGRSKVASAIIAAGEKARGK